MKNISMKKNISKSLIVVMMLAIALPMQVATVNAAVNLVQNPSVETEDAALPGQPEHWSMGGFGTNTRNHEYVTLPSGGKAVKVEITAYPAGDPMAGDAKWFFESVPVEGGALYSFSVSYSSTTESYLYAAFINSDGIPYHERIAAIPSSGGAWMTGAQQFTVPAQAQFAAVYHVIESVGVLTTDDYSMTKIAEASENQFSKGVVSITFDDGWVSQYNNAAPKLAAANMHASFYAVSDTFANNNPDYMSVAQLLELQTAGHEVSAHTVHHCKLTEVPSAASCAFAPPSGTTINDEIVNSINALLGAGLTPVSTFAYPNGAYNDQVKNLMSGSGMIAARSVDSGFNTRFSDRYALKTQVMEQAINIDMVKGWIDDAAENKTWLVLTFHQVDLEGNIIGDDGAVTPSYFQDIIDYLAAKRIDPVNSIEIKTLAEVVPDLAGSIPPPPPLDTLAPVIVLNGDASMNLTVGDAYTEAGATATDNVDTTLTIAITGPVDTATPGVYTVSYNTSDAAGNAAPTITRTVTVSAVVTTSNTAPVITLNGSATVNITVNDTYTEAGATATDAEDGNIASSSISVSGTVDMTTIGTYTRTYNVEDSAGLAATPVTRTIIVQAVTNGSGNNGGGTSGPVSGGGGGGGGGGYVPPAVVPPVVVTPPVTTPGEVLGSTCSALVTQNLNMANKKNSVAEVKKLQTFLNKHMNAKLPVTGYFGSMTKASVMKFQTQYKAEVLTPAKLTKANGNAYTLTRAKINALNCTLPQ
jgi:peptidoglycan/xylan/chitin deacetylase (PgdA/CDA1 family)